MANRKYYNLSNENIENKINEIQEWLDNTKLNKIKKELNELNNTIITKYRTGFQLSEEEKNELEKTRMNEKRIHGFKLDDSIKLTTNVEECIKDKDLLIFAIPAAFVDSLCISMAPYPSNLI